jgi:hypothetical protein
VVSSAPPSDEVLSDVAQWAAAFGNRDTSPVVTGVRDPHRRPRDPERAELGCYGQLTSYCALSGGLTEGEACDSLHGCAAGLDCDSNASAPAQLRAT